MLVLSPIGPWATGIGSGSHASTPMMLMEALPDLVGQAPLLSTLAIAIPAVGVAMVLLAIRWPLPSAPTPRLAISQPPVLRPPRRRYRWPGN